jgi:hypothetical protein
MGTYETDSHGFCKEHKHGFTYCGIIYLLSGDERLAYQKYGKET